MKSDSKALEQLRDKLPTMYEDVLNAKKTYATDPSEVNRDKVNQFWNCYVEVRDMVKQAEGNAP